jgi:hypothetical protein
MLEGTWFDCQRFRLMNSESFSKSISFTVSGVCARIPLPSQNSPKVYFDPPSPREKVGRLRRRQYLYKLQFGTQKSDFPLECIVFMHKSGQNGQKHRKNQTIIKYLNTIFRICLMVI